MKKLAKTSKAKTIVPKTFEEMIELNRQFFKYAGMIETSKYADVLSALRGPDNGNYTTKIATTCIIRRAFLGNKYYESHQSCWEVVDRDAKTFLKTRQKLKESHFQRHVLFAFDSLGLKWNEVNEFNLE